MISGTSAQVLGTVDSSAAATTSTGEAAAADGAFGEALAGAQTVLDAATTAAGDATTSSRAEATTQTAGTEASAEAETEVSPETDGEATDGEPTGESGGAEGDQPTGEAEAAAANAANAGQGGTTASVAGSASGAAAAAVLVPTAGTQVQPQLAGEIDLAPAQLVAAGSAQAAAVQASLGEDGQQVVTPIVTAEGDGAEQATAVASGPVVIETDAEVTSAGGARGATSPGSVQASVAGPASDSAVAVESGDTAAELRIVTPNQAASTAAAGASAAASASAGTAATDATGSSEAVAASSAAGEGAAATADETQTGSAVTVEAAEDGSESEGPGKGRGAETGPTRAGADASDTAGSGDSDGGSQGHADDRQARGGAGNPLHANDENEHRNSPAVPAGQLRAQAAAEAEAAAKAQPQQAAASSVELDAGTQSGTQQMSGDVPVRRTAVADQAAQARLSQERIEHLAEQLGTKLKLSHAAGGSQVHLALRPRELGEVQVQLAVRDGVVAATVMVDRAETGRLLQNNLDDLRRALEAQGLAVQHFSVDVRGRDGSAGFEGEGRGNGSRSGAVAGLGSGDDERDHLRTIDPDDLHDGSVSLLA